MQDTAVNTSIRENNEGGIRYNKKEQRPERRCSSVLDALLFL